MTRTVWPHEVKHLFGRFGIQRKHLGPPSASPRARERVWMFDICGPFCLWPPRRNSPLKSNTSSHSGHLANILSEMLKLPTIRSLNGEVVSIKVLLTDEQRVVLLHEEYEEATHPHRLPH